MLSFWQGGSFCALPGLGVKDFRRPWSNVVATQVNPDLAPGRYPGPPTQERRPRISEAKPEQPQDVPGLALGIRYSVRPGVVPVSASLFAGLPFRPSLFRPVPVLPVLLGFVFPSYILLYMRTAHQDRCS